MKLIQGNLFDSKDDVILITGNSYINTKGELVMGRGAALELKTKYPKLAYTFGKMIQYYCKHLGEYNLIISGLGETRLEELEDNDWPKYGVFQVKYHYKDDADYGLIERSTNVLINMMNRLGYRDRTFSMNFPGIGWGRLEAEKVLSLINKLSDRVTIYYK
jgi:hypothetical protein